MRVLVVAADVPFPPVGGARTRNFHLLRALAAEHDVTVCAFHFGDDIARPPFDVELRTVPWEEPATWTEPFGVAYYASEAMEQAVAAADADLVVLTETPMGRFRPDGVPCVFDLHDVHARKLARAPDAEAMRRFESAVARACALTVCVSDVEAEAARTMLGAERVAVVPNGVDTSYFTPGDGPGDDGRIVFTGSMHTESNVEAVLWLAAEVLPRLPGVVLDVVGAGPPAEILALEGPRVRVHGRVDDVREHLRGAAVAVVPIRHGGGTRLKLLEAAACGRAIVTTGVGMEGLDFAPGCDLERADDPAAFAGAVAALCADPPRRLELGAAARAAAAAYDWRAVGARWRAALEEAAA